MSKQLYFLAGLPRSGSTVLASLLSQNPELYVSPTSPLLGLMFGAKQMWDVSVDHVRGYEMAGRLERVLGAIAQSFYADIDRPYVIDKNRAWVNPVNQEMLKEVLGKQPKIVCTVRPVTEILASFISLIRKNPTSISFIDRDLTAIHESLTDENRCRFLMSPEGHVYQSWAALKAGFGAFPENILFVPYDELVGQPEETLKGVYSFLGVPSFPHSFSHIVNPVQENDERAYNLPGMHTIRPILEKRSPDARSVLGDLLWERYQGGEFWKN